jgi:hypothetical protein
MRLGGADYWGHLNGAGGGNYNDRSEYNRGTGNEAEYEKIRKRKQ